MMIHLKLDSPITGARREASRGDRWKIFRIAPGRWVAGPEGHNVVVSLVPLRVWAVFETFDETLAFVLGRVYGR